MSNDNDEVTGFLGMNACPALDECACMSGCEKCQPNVVHPNFHHPSNVLMCGECGSPMMWLRLDGTINCGDPDCKAPMPHHWFIPPPTEIA